MLRSDNIQVRSQLSGTQRRMLQEKQQVMDYLRQIENDLVEKEQIKQRESILRKDFERLQSTSQHDRQEIEQLQTKINQDKQKLDQLEEERVQLLKTIENIDGTKLQLESEMNSYRSAAKRLCSHFKLPFESAQTIDQLLPIIEERSRAQQAAQVRVSLSLSLSLRSYGCGRMVVSGSRSSHSARTIGARDDQSARRGRDSPTAQRASVDERQTEATARGQPSLGTVSKQSSVLVTRSSQSQRHRSSVIRRHCAANRRSFQRPKESSQRTT